MVEHYKTVTVTEAVNGDPIAEVSCSCGLVVRVDIDTAALFVAYPALEKLHTERSKLQKEAWVGEEAA